MSSVPGFLRRMLAGLWRGITRLRVALSNLVFLLFLVVLIAVFFDSAPQPLPAKAALLLDPVGTVVEQKTYADPVAQLFSEEVPSEHEVLLADVLEAIEYAKDDPGITALVMELGQLYGIGIAKSEDIAAALEDFRSSGKPIIAWGDYFSQSQYYLASYADEIILHPMGAIQIEGFGRYQWYFKEALEKLSIKVNVFRTGKYKSAVEPFMRSDMSLEERGASQRWLAQLWALYTGALEQNRELEAGAVSGFVNDYAEILERHAGDTAQVALEYGLVDRLENRGAANRHIVDKVGAADEDGHYEAISFERYLAQKKPIFDPQTNDSAVALIVASGTIYDGDQPAGDIGGNSLGRLIVRAADDETIKSIVLRIDSGGGSAFASEVIRQKLLYAKNKGKPVVVSMGSLAASGGYWIAADADEVWASPATLTGSIGVFGVYPTVDEALQRMGIAVDGVGTTELAGKLRTDRPLDRRVAQILQASVDNIYARFLSLVAEGRGLPVEQVAELAEGRVWSGADAHELGLVDELGGLDEAIVAAARLAELEHYEVELIERALDPQELFWLQLAGEAQTWVNLPTLMPEWMLRAWAPVYQSAKFFMQMNDPMGVYARCETCTGQ